jgi:hypothetical protein
MVPQAHHAGQEDFMIDPHHPFYDAAWRRVVIPLVCFVWAGIELYAGATFWAAIVGALGLYAAYKLWIERARPIDKD